MVIWQNKWWEFGYWLLLWVSWNKRQLISDHKKEKSKSTKYISSLLSCQVKIAWNFHFLCKSNYSCFLSKFFLKCTQVHIWFKGDFFLSLLVFLNCNPMLYERTNWDIVICGDHFSVLPRSEKYNKFYKFFGWRARF